MPAYFMCSSHRRRVLIHRLRESFTVTVTKIFLAGFFWQVGGFAADAWQANLMETSNRSSSSSNHTGPHGHKNGGRQFFFGFATCAGLGDAAGVFIGHTLLTFLGACVCPPPSRPVSRADDGDGGDGTPCLLSDCPSTTNVDGDNEGGGGTQGRWCGRCCNVVRCRASDTREEGTRSPRGAMVERVCA